MWEESDGERRSMRRAQLASVLLTAQLAASGSQGRQDLILKTLFDRIGTANKYFVEFGFNSPGFDVGAEGTGANTEMLYRQGWRGLLLDGSRSNASINLHQSFIKSTNIVDTFQTHKVPIELDYLSIDIDSADLWVMRALLAVYRPRVVSIEYNSNYDVDGPDASAITLPDPSTMPIRNHQASWAGHCYFGTSARAVLAVARANGYMLAAVEPRLDMFMVRKDLWERARLADPSALGLNTTIKTITHHQPMSKNEAENLIDYETYVETGSLCKARAAAAKTLLEYIQNGARASTTEIL